MRSLGDKISSTIVAQHAKVPCMPWSGTGITDTEMSPQGFVTVPDGPYQAACVKTVEDGLVRAEKVGYPIMIKASEGGGGKGIRMVHAKENFKNSFHAVASEVPGEPNPQLFTPSRFAPSSRPSPSLYSFFQDLPSSSWLLLDRLDISRFSSSRISTETPSPCSDETARSSDDIRRSLKRLLSPSPNPRGLRRWRRLPSDLPSSSDTSRQGPSSVSFTSPSNRAALH